MEQNKNKSHDWRPDIRVPHWGCWAVVVPLRALQSVQYDSSLLYYYPNNTKFIPNVSIYLYHT